MKTRFDEEVAIKIGNLILKGQLILPAKANAIIVFSHGSGSSRFSERNIKVAKHLHEKNFGTLLFDLLTEQEDKEYENRFNINLLSKRLIGATEWLASFPASKECSIGYFGASTGAASALQAAAQLKSVKAVVSRGGRPDLAMPYLHYITAPTLLIVGGYDTVVIELNRKALDKLHCTKELIIVEEATHLFPENGKMDEVAELASEWFENYLNLVTV